MKRRVVLTALALGLGANQARANPDPTPPTDLSGSDTMREITIDVISACGVGGALRYAGGGSSLGGQKMSPALFGPSGDQQIAPQSRFLNITECSAVATNAGQGFQVGLDGIAVFHDFTEFTECRTLRYAGCMAVQDLNNAATLGFGTGSAGPDDGTGAAVPAQHCFTNWADVLRIIYTGQHTSLPSSPSAACISNAPAASAITARRCNSDVRRTLVENWANMFDTSRDDGAGGCTDAFCTRLSHAWRRDDLSGTTDTFLSLIGAPGVGTGFNVRTFCNGLENEDLDPIRRNCVTNSNASLDPETVCAPIPFRNRNAPFGTDGSPNSQPGSLAPIPPAANSVGDLGLVLPISLPQDLDLQYDNTFCTTSPIGGSFRFVPMPPALSLNGQRCPDGNTRVSGQCRFPVYAAGPRAGQFNCKSRRTNRPGAIAWTNFDARSYNLSPRDPITGAILQANSNSVQDPRWGGGGHYRIHTTSPQPSQTGAAYFAQHPTCNQQDATTQIGCLVQADPCSIGFAGLEAEDQDVTPEEEAVAGTNLPWALRVPVDTNTGETNSNDEEEVEPRVTTIQRLTEATGAACEAGAGNYDTRYPLARILYLNSSKGFGIANGFPGVMGNITNTVDSNDADSAPDLLTRENDLARCYANRAIVDPIVQEHGFIALPGAAVYPDSRRLRICSCGDNTVQAALGETCDDGNVTAGDGCSNVCRTE